MSAARAAAPLEPPAVAAGGGASGTPYADYDVVGRDKWALDWDEKTRRLVLDRLRHVPAFRFFSTEEARTLEAACERIVPQGDRPPHQRVPIAPWIDDRLHRGAGDGYRYEDMPDDREAYCLALRGLDETARHLFHAPFADLDDVRRDEVLRRVASGEPPGETWRDLPAKRFFQGLVGAAIRRYYAHPAAWAEIGFGGPASPRGHIRLALGKRDPWEAAERRPRSSVALVRRALDSRGADGADAAGGPTH